MTTIRKIIFAAALFAVPVIAVCAEPWAARVIADHVNLRAKASATAEVVAQVSSNDLLAVRSWGPDWIEVTPPADADLWVHKDLIKDAEVLTQNVNVRAGPGPNHAILGKVSPGDKIEPKGQFGDWVKIAPPESASLWIAATMVQIQHPEALPGDASAKGTQNVAEAEVKAIQPSVVEMPLQAITEPDRQSPQVSLPQTETVTIALPAQSATPEPALTDAPEGSVTTALLVSATSSTTSLEQEAPALPAAFPLLPVAGQGTMQLREGTLHTTGYVFRSPSRYRLVGDDGNTICYMNGNQNQLRSLLGRRMSVTGREYWVRGKDYPVLTVERIVLISGK